MVERVEMRVVLDGKNDAIAEVVLPEDLIPTNYESYRIPYKKGSLKIPKHLISLLYGQVSLLAAAGGDDVQIVIEWKDD